GTGDLAIALCRSLRLPVVAADFCHPMLEIANSKIAAADCGSAVRTVEADASRLPFADAQFDAVTNAFGLRNLQNRGQGLAEMNRILKPGGVAVILEFSQPETPVFRTVFGFYFRNILPRVGALVSRQPTAYTYLPESVSRFPGPQRLSEMMRDPGFTNVG